MPFNKKYLVALSGGADSVALFVCLHELGYNVEAVHCNFHLRGEESNRDESFCRELCRNYATPIHVAHFATREYALGHKLSIEMAARRLRYDYFERLIIDIGADAIVVAHHKDDSAETILMNLIRGTGIHGLLGISPVNGHVLRPLLGVHRKDIVEYLIDKGQNYVTDSSNLLTDVVRNKVRLSILPMMQEINPSVCDAIINTSSRLRQISEMFDEIMTEKEAKMFIKEEKGIRYYDLNFLKEEYSLFRILHPIGFSPSEIESIYSSIKKPSSGKYFYSKTHEIVFHRGQMLIRKKHYPFVTINIPMHGVYVISQHKKISLKIASKDEVEISKKESKAFFDADKVFFPLQVRSYQKGDRFCPFGMKGSKLVSDFLTDLKRNLFEKQDQLVLVDAKCNILWIVGIRPDNRYRINEQTTNVIVAEIFDQDI